MTIFADAFQKGTDNSIMKFIFERQANNTMLKGELHNLWSKGPLELHFFFPNFCLGYDWVITDLCMQFIYKVKQQQQQQKKMCIFFFPILVAKLLRSEFRKVEN